MMKKIKFFIEPIEEIEAWLNEQVAKGYRLKSVNNFIYNFEKTSDEYRYSTQFIGSNAPDFNKGYVTMLQDSGFNVFRAPLNQGNIAFGKVRLRPYVKGSGKLANTFQDYNKEIVIVENKGNQRISLLTNYKDLSQQYKNIRNAYLQGFVLVFLFFCLSVYQWIEGKSGMIFLVTLSFLLVVLGLILRMTLIANKNFKKYKKALSISE